MRFGVLGTGPWARAVHAPALAGHPSAELVGVWGRDLAKAKALGAEFDVPGFDDLDELLDRADADGLAVTAAHLALLTDLAGDRTAVTA